MKKIAPGVYIENAFDGVIIGAVPLGEGLLLIDAPLRPDDGRAWMATLRGLKGGADRMLVYLDAHTDRTLGGKALDSTIIAHEYVCHQFEDRPSIFKAQIQESGDTWETCTGLSGIRWASPNLGCTRQARLRWQDTEILLMHQPGPDDGASWVCLPEEKILFTGDLVTRTQPPILKNADLPAWEESLGILAKEYKDYTLISSRDGVFTEREIKEMKKFISNTHRQMERLNRRKAKPQDTEKLVDKMIGGFEFDPRYRNHYYQRLKYGLFHCYSKRYLQIPEDNDK